MLKCIKSFKVNAKDISSAKEEIEDEQNKANIIINTKSNTSNSIASDKKPLLIKGYKITDNERSKKFGVGASSLEMLKTKAKVRFPNVDEVHIYLSSDGSEVADEEYFVTLESQTVFIVADADAIVTTESEYKYEQLTKRSPILAVNDIINNILEQHPDKLQKLVFAYHKLKEPQLLKDKKVMQCKTELSLKNDHFEWFAGGVEEKCNTKEEALARRAQDRIRTYYYKTKQELTRHKSYRQNAKVRQIIDATLEKFRYLLIGCDYFSMMFNRKHPHKHESVKELIDDIDSRCQIPNKKMKEAIKSYASNKKLLDKWSLALCNSVGDFYCQGPYSIALNHCKLCHSINPYASRENLILFQVWNLDHQIELTRTILPDLIDNVVKLAGKTRPLCDLHQKPVVDISVFEYFLEIFSIKNLKLVHIVCHEKVQRSNRSNGRLLCTECDEYQIVKELMNVKCPDEADAF